MSETTTAVFIAADNIISPLGNTTVKNFLRLKENVSGIKLHEDTAISDVPFYAALFDRDEWDMKPAAGLTKFEQLLVVSVTAALSRCDVDAKDPRTLLVVSSTKGNISLLENTKNIEGIKDRIALHTSAQMVADHFGFVNKPVVVSNACISGLLAILTGMRLIQAGQCDHVVVTGADVISRFVLSGFQSFRAVSGQPCRPFDKERDGITLGESAGTIILSSDKRYNQNIKVAGGGTSNDANHISGPSRTGAELYQIIQSTLDKAGLSAAGIDLISAHGTATVYNDEMEAKAIALAGIQSVPVNSLKGYYGHTLGAAGIIESIITVQSMREGVIIGTKGFEQPGEFPEINVCSAPTTATLRNCLKTASGFGGCNGAVLFSKR